MERYIERNGKRLRYGYTTGSCASAAAKAAALALLQGIESDTMTIDTPKGWVIDIEVLLRLQSTNFDCEIVCGSVGWIISTLGQ